MEKIEIIIGSPVDYDELVAYLVVDGKYVALVNQDEGKDNLKIEFFDKPNLKEVHYDTFLAALREAKEKLLEE
ncbi:hypothetical protein EYV94_27245 [Puteibacter caeruleilacunae]|nr:hypothetical protein EYV94_27245 [Puteibacter caeruleilacunae]